MTAAPPRAPVAPLPRPADAATQQARRLRFTAAVGAFRTRAGLAHGSVRRRQSLQLCTAARLLTALGIRVDVAQPPTAWPRDVPQRLVVTNTAGLLGDLALLIAVPRTTTGWSDVADRVLPVRAPLRPAGRDDDALGCPVVVAHRVPPGLPHPRTLNDVIAVRGLVIEVRLLPATTAGKRRAA